MNSTFVFTLLFAIFLLTSATHVSENTHMELTADIAFRAKNMLLPVKQVDCVMNEASIFAPHISAEGEKQYDIIAYREYVTAALVKCINPEGDDSVSGLARKWEKVNSSCTCTSGCHFCCISAGLGGSDSCFREICSSALCNGKAFCN